MAIYGQKGKREGGVGNFAWIAAEEGEKTHPKAGLEVISIILLK